jgi:hypothetical protein
MLMLHINRIFSFKVDGIPEKVPFISYFIQLMLVNKLQFVPILESALKSTRYRSFTVRIQGI